MSLLLEESSPTLSDCKMDISDATTSHDSVGVSPEDEPEAKKKAATVHNNHNDDDALSSMTAQRGDTQNENDDDLLLQQMPPAVCRLLDNRRPKVLPLEQMPLRQSSARTLANSHPLMMSSPPGTDDSDESERSGRHQVGHQLPPSTAVGDINCHNFPDVVPRIERIMQSKQLPSEASLSAVAVRNSLNNMRGSVGKAAVALPPPTPPPHNNLTVLRAHSPDLLSSESEDISQYHAAVDVGNFQAVALIPNNNATNCGATNKSRSRSTRKTTAAVASGAGGGGDDISSLDSISNHSFDDDEDLEHNLASLSPSSSLIDGLDDDDDDDDDCEGPELLPPGGGVDDDDDFPEATTPTPSTRPRTALTSAAAGAPAPASDALPQYSAAEERRDSRNWQKITLPDGRTREIDMRVIEPYKRVLSHGGYLKAGGHNAIVIFCACHLPDRSRADYNYVMDNLFLYVVKTLEQLVTEDYVLIYLHGGTSRRNVPPFPWLKKCYQLLDRRLRKSLKTLYLVHPTFWIKSIVWMARPFVSAKFWRKLIYVKSLGELGIHVAVEKAAIPDKVKQYDAKHN